MSGVIFLTFSRRWRLYSVSSGMVATRRVKANGARQLERTLKRSMSRAMHLDRATTPIFAAP
ncbi:hypothetical protein D9M70_572510 [compost metagenome]